MSVNSRLKATKIIGQRKAFYRQRIPEPSCARKETIDIDILVTCRNGHRKIMQSIRITSRPPSKKRKWCFALSIAGVFDVSKYRHFCLIDFHMIHHRRHKLFKVSFCIFSRSYLLNIYLQTSISGAHG